MQDKNEINKVELELLNLRLAETEAERDRFQKEVQALNMNIREQTTIKIEAANMIHVISKH